MKVVSKLFLISLFIIPFVQGIYFLHQNFFWMLFIIALLISVLIIRKDIIISNEKTLLFFVGLFMLYLISCCYAVDYGMALLGALKYLTYVCFLLLCIQFNEDGFRKKAILAFSYGMAATATIGVLSFYINFLGERIIRDNRLGGVFQYANTYGLCCIIACFLIFDYAENKIAKALATILLVMGTILTFSRSVIFLGLFAFAFKLVIEKKERIARLGLTLIGIFAAGIVIWERQLTAVTRVKEVSGSASEWVARLGYYKDAISIIKEHPFGTGYLGFYYVERLYQTGATYYVKFVHCSVLQLMLDVGILGGILFLCFFAYHFFKRDNTWGNRIILAIVFVHSLIDFDFEFSILWAILILIVLQSSEGSIKILEQKNRNKHKDNSLVSRTLFISVFLCIAGIYTYFGIASSFTYYGQHQKAYELYPYYTEAKIKHLNMEQSTNTYNDYFDALTSSIINQNDYSVEAYAWQRDYALYRKEYESAMELAIKTVQLNPLNIKQVEIYSTILLEYSVDAFYRGEYKKSQEALEVIFNIPQYLESLRHERVKDPSIRHAPSLIMTDILTKNQEDAEQLYERIKTLMNAT